jgi:L-fucose dehydrogenase
VGGGCDFSNKVVLITGGSKGIGAGCAKVFVEAGASVLICDVDSENGEKVASSLDAKGPGRCQFEKCDVGIPSEVNNAIDAAVESCGRLDCLINNAAIFPRFRPIDECSVEEFEVTLRVNLIGYFVACKFALPYLRRFQGSVINMGSLTSVLGHHFATIYCATKGGISAFSKALAIEEAKNGVRVNAVLPGNILTQSRVNLEASMKDGRAFHDYVEKWQWIGRSGTVEEVGQACLFLASDQARFITGIELILSGAAELGYGPKVPVPEF